MNDKKNIRDQGIEDLLPHLMLLGDKTLTKFEQTILTKILLKKLTFNEVAKTNKLPMLRQKQLFSIGIRRLSKVLDYVSENIENSKALENELSEAKRDLAEAKEKLKALQDSIDKRNTLSPELKELIDTPIDKIGFSARVLNICLRVNIDTIADLVSYSRHDFSALRDMGEKSFNEVETYLKNKGLTWKMKF
ncbi:MAG TPA: DNA-directed RNA polymerase subunit alpha C-terminal domain-containing protein [Bacteroidia bacterium]